MKLLNTLQELVDKTKELEETVATQTSTIERLTSQLYLANKDNASDNDTITSNLANGITTKLSTINPDLRPATNLSEFLLHYGYIHGYTRYTRSDHYNDTTTYEFDYKGKRYTLHQYDTLTQVKHIITDIVNKDLEHLLDNYTKWAIANNK